MNLQLQAIKAADIEQRASKLEQRLAVDTSAILAMLRNETEAPMFAKAVEEAGRYPAQLALLLCFLLCFLRAWILTELVIGYM
jgi:hypothetical protein